MRRRGSPLDVSINIDPVPDASGRVTAFASVIRDITDRKRAEAALRASEERYRRLVETAHEGVWTIDAEGCTT